LQSVGDWMGRSFATLTQWPGPGTYSEIGVSAAVLARISFIPLLMRCNIAPSNRGTQIWFPSDAAFVVLMSVFSFTGGYLGNVGLMLGPKKVALRLQESAGMMFTIVLVFGVGFGSTLGPSIVTLL